MGTPPWNLSFISFLRHDLVAPIKNWKRSSNEVLPLVLSTYDVRLLPYHHVRETDSYGRERTKNRRSGSDRTDEERTTGESPEDGHQRRGTWNSKSSPRVLSRLDLLYKCPTSLTPFTYRVPPARILGDRFRVLLPRQSPGTSELWYPRRILFCHRNKDTRKSPSLFPT